jgi:hypothetical protein
MSRRRDTLTFSHHVEVASVWTQQAQDDLLEWAENDGKPRTIRELRDEVKSVKAYLAQGWNSSQLERKAKARRDRVSQLSKTTSLSVNRIKCANIVPEYVPEIFKQRRILLRSK